MRRFILVAVIVITSIAGLAYALTWPSPPPAAKLIASAGPDSPHVWLIEDMSGGGNGEVLWAVVRVSHDREPTDNSSASNTVERSLQLASQETVVGGVLCGHASTALVSIQRIDLNDLAATSDPGHTSLRLVVRLSCSGASTASHGKQTALAGNAFDGEDTFNDADWKNGELHLQTLRTVADGSTISYKIFLRRGS